MNLFENLLGWGTHASYSRGTVTQWLAGLAGVVLLALLWNMALKEID